MFSHIVEPMLKLNYSNALNLSYIRGSSTVPLGLLQKWQLTEYFGQEDLAEISFDEIKTADFFCERLY